MQRTAGITGLAALCVAALVWLLAPADGARAYLSAYVFWLSMAGGALGMHMLHELVGGAWGRRIQHITAGAEATFPLLMLLFVPIALSAQAIYPWPMEREANAAPWAWYLNRSGFLGRAAGCFVVWIGLWLLLLAFGSRNPDRRAGVRARRAVSGAGLVLYFIGMTVASVDWVSSLEPEWFSPIFGLSFIAGAALAFIAFAFVVSYAAEDPPEMDDIAQRDLAHLMLAFLMLWAYLVFSQYLIIWSGNLPHEVSYYVRRQHGGWRAVAWVLVLGHFLLPFLLLLSGEIKARLRRLAIVAVVVLGMRLVDVAWLIWPALQRERSWTVVFDLVMWVAIGGLWLFVFAAGAKSWLRRHDQWEQSAEAGELAHAPIP